eukprot:scaffold11438_cov129-Isochrysis_galbana.AAC.2
MATKAAAWGLGAGSTKFMYSRSVHLLSRQAAPRIWQGGETSRFRPLRPAFAACADARASGIASVGGRGRYRAG